MSKRVRVSLALSYMFFVFASTVLARNANSIAKYDWTPLRILQYDQWWTRSDLISQILANIAMSIPISFLLAPNLKARSIIVGLTFSISIELCQMVFHRGFCELDDIISNTLGACIGYFIYLFVSSMNSQTIKGYDEMYKRYFKRWLDVIISSLALVLLSPILLITAILIKLDSKGPVLFKQTRLGMNHKEFQLIKFRSMIVNAEHMGTGVYSEAGDNRVTRVGRIIRAISIDELPQLWNVLKGDMSLIGPRPPLTYHPWPIDKYTSEQLRMFEVRPGITGWAQIHGRKHVEWNKRIELNIWYVDHCSFILDVQILAKTVLKVITNADNVSEGATVSKK